jgi:hypothetical protein
MLTETTTPKFRSGQIWNYQTRKGEESSWLTVVKTDSHPQLGNIIHISVSGLKFQNPHAPDGFSTELEHLPIAEVSLLESVTELVETTDSFLDFPSGYDLWKEAFERKEAGIWSFPVQEIVRAMEEALNQ